MAVRFSMNGLLQSVQFKKEYHKIFKEGELIAFNPGLNLLVGDQGTGKSSLLELLSNRWKNREEVATVLTSGHGTLRYFDTERMNPRTKSHIDNTLDIVGRFMSHGQVSKPIVLACEQWKDEVILLDEPDAALSPRSCHEIARLLRRLAEVNNCQVIAAVHSPILIESVDQVLSVEHRRWMPGTEFLRLHSEG